MPSWISAMLHAQGTTLGDPAGQSHHHGSKHRRHRRLPMFPLRRRPLGQKDRPGWYFLGALLSVPTTFLFISDFIPALIVSPIMGFFAAGVFTGFAIYFPELFPTAIRATAQGFCFNFARFFSAGAPFVAGVLISAHGSFAPAIATIGSIYFLGLVSFASSRGKLEGKRCRINSVEQASVQNVGRAVQAVCVRLPLPVTRTIKLEIPDTASDRVL